MSMLFSDRRALTQFFCMVLQEVCLDCDMDSSEGFLEKAVEFSNQCWGTLACSLFIKPSTRRKYQTAYSKAIEDLKFGSIVVNGPTTLGFALTSLSWGAFPGELLNCQPQLQLL